MSTAHKLFLLGLDGATFDLLGPWMEAGHLPHLKRLTQEGAWGELQSTRPPATAPAWTACITGVNPGQHGIFDFRESPALDPRRPLVSSRSIRAPTLWHILSHHGRQVGVLNVPITYPPEPVNGFLVGGMMTPGPDSDYTYPPALKGELNARRYVIDVEIQKYDVEAEADARRFLDDIETSLRRRAEALFYLMDTRPWHFIMVVFVALDRIQHLFWKTLADPDSRFYNAPQAPQLRARILSIYQVVDGLVGQIMDRLAAAGDTDLVVVSDHGFGSTKAWFNVNRWLQQQGWLHLKPGAALRKRLFYEAMRVNDSRLTRAVLPESLARAIRGRIRGGRSAFKTDLDQCIDWPRTQAFFASIPAQGIYLHPSRTGATTPPSRAGKVLPPSSSSPSHPAADYEALRAEIARRLLALTDPRTGERIVDHVWRREELYHGPHAHLAPDLLFVARDYAILGRELLGTRGPLETSMNWGNGFHRMNGVLLAWGPHMRPGARIEGATMLDIAPTLLYDLGLPVPDNMEGRVLTGLLDPDFVAANPIRHEPPLSETEWAPGSAYTAGEQAEIAAHLAALGYIE